MIAKIFHLDVEKLKTLIREKFTGKDESIVNAALMAFQAGYGYPVGNVLTKQYKFETIVPKEGDRAQITMDGNQALAYGLIAAGVRYGAGYPITPWSSVMEILRGELPKYGGIFVQAEDELGAISLALGFSFSGYLAVTGSAGPGMSFKTEAIGWASMSEMPLIIINVQRGGPSTGLPTNMEQSDLFQAIFGGHGDSPRVVLAPGRRGLLLHRDRSRPHRPQIQHAGFHFQRHLARDAHRGVRRTEAQGMDGRSETRSFAACGRIEALCGGSDHAHVPPGAPMMDGKYPLVSGLEHDEMGHPTGSPKLHMAMTAKRRKKLRKLAEEIPVPEIYGDQEGGKLLIGWGSTSGAIQDAERLRANMVRRPALHLRHVHPLPNGLEKIFANSNASLSSK